MKNFEVISPIDGSTYLQRDFADAKQIEKALKQAVSAQASWKNLPLEKRIKLCRAAVSYLVDRADTLGEEITHQMGRPIRYTPGEITGSFQERALYMIDTAEKALSDKHIEDSDDFLRLITHDPVGTVLVLSPWNYPYLTSVNAVIPALLAGNTVLMKHALQTPLTAERYAEAFQEAGIPDGVFQYIHADHLQIAGVIQDQRINAVSFTGSVKGGTSIQEAAAKRFINIGLELGGKDPAYVRPDAFFESTVANLVDGAFFNSGQSCCGIERIYVHTDIYSSFVDAFTGLTREYILGNPLDPSTTLGPMVSVRAAERTLEQIDHAIRAGAMGCIDPDTFSSHDPSSAYVAPQVLINVDHSMEIMTEETFAPVVGIMPVRHDEEAIDLMNDSKYGLTASVWTSDLNKGQSLAKLVNTGTVFCNRCDYLDPALAWTGVGHSGRGYTLSEMGFAAFTRPKSYHLRKKI